MCLIIIGPSLFAVAQRGILQDVLLRIKPGTLTNYYTTTYVYSYTETFIQIKTGKKI